MYKKVVAPLIVLLCSTEDDIDVFNNLTLDIKYHRFFILANKNLKILMEFKNTDSLIILEHEKLDYETIARFATVFSNPQYTHILIILSKKIDINQQLLNFQNKDRFVTDYCIGFTRYEAALNEFKFDIAKSKNLNPLEYYEELDKALKGEKVNFVVFKEALNELLPFCAYDFDDNLNLDNDIKIIFNKKTKESKTKYMVTNNIISENEKNVIVFTFSEINKFKYVLRRDDGLNFYIK